MTDLTPEADGFMADYGPQDARAWDEMQRRLSLVIESEVAAAAARDRAGLVEMVAKGLHDARHGDDFTWESEPERWRRVWRERAREALAIPEAQEEADRG